MAQYRADFPVGSGVQIASREVLKRFQESWKYHNNVTDGPLGYAGRHAVVTEVSNYVGGAPLYSLKGVPGIWHEELLAGAESQSPGR